MEFATMMERLVVSEKRTDENVVDLSNYNGVK